MRVKQLSMHMELCGCVARPDNSEEERRGQCCNRWLSVNKRLKFVCEQQLAVLSLQNAI